MQGQSKGSNEMANFMFGVGHVPANRGINHHQTFREMTPNPNQKEGQKKSIEYHLQDIIHSCSLKDFYKVKEVYSRTNLCSISGMLLEIRDPKIAKFYTITSDFLDGKYKLTHKKDPKVSEDREKLLGQQKIADSKETSKMDSSLEQASQILRINHTQPPKNQNSVYQRCFTDKVQVRNCSVSDKFIVYSLMFDNLQTQEASNSQPQATSKISPEDISSVFDLQGSPKTTDRGQIQERGAQAQNMVELTIVVDLLSQEEIVIPNPSKNQKISALYIDDQMLLIGCQDEIFELKPADLFRNEELKSKKVGLDRESDLFEQYVTQSVLPEQTSSQNNYIGLNQGVIYAFWHTRNMAKADIFVRDRVSAELRIFTYWTREGLEKQQNNLRRKYSNQADSASKIEKLLERQIQLNSTINLDQNLIADGQILKIKDFDASINTKSLQSLEIKKLSINEQNSSQNSDDNSSSDADDQFSEDEEQKLQREVKLTAANQNNDTDDEHFVSSDDNKDSHSETEVEPPNSGLLKKLRHSESVVHYSGEEDINSKRNSKKSVSFQDDGFMRQANNTINQQQIIGGPSRSRGEQSQLSETAIDDSFRNSNSLQSPLLSQYRKRIDSTNSYYGQSQSPDLKKLSSWQKHNSSLKPQILGVKFHWRQTLVFRSDGQIDIVTSNKQVYSTHAIDFERMNYRPALSKAELRDRLVISPKFVDAIADDHGDILLITEKKIVYLFNTEKMTISRPKIALDQAKLFPYSNIVNLFPNFVVYDNIVMVSHAHIISICDLNAKVCQKASWRHLNVNFQGRSTKHRTFCILSLLGKRDGQISALPYSADDSEACITHWHQVFVSPFLVGSQDVRTIRISESTNKADPAIIVFYKDNHVQQMVRDRNHQWQFESDAILAMQDQVLEVVTSNKQSSMILIRHRSSEQVNGERSSLSIFQFKDKASAKDWETQTVIDDLKDHQRVFSVNLSNMTTNLDDRNSKNKRPRIGVYDNQTHIIKIFELQQRQQDQTQLSQKENLTVQQNKGFGYFKEIYQIKDFRMSASDVTVESGISDFIFISQQNKIYKLHTTFESFQRAKLRRQGDFMNKKKIVNGESSHENLEFLAQIESKVAKHQVQIESFRIFNDNQTTYVYASSRNHVYFNTLQQFGRLFVGSRLLPASLSRQNYALYSDDIYNQIATFNGPFEIMVLPFLHSNRVSLRGAHHTENAVFFQSRGQQDLHVLTEDSQIKTWDTQTGKLVKSSKVSINSVLQGNSRSQSQQQTVGLNSQNCLSGFQKMNTFRGRTLLSRQEPTTMRFTYLCLEINSAVSVVEHARIESENHMMMFVNSQNNLIFTESKDANHLQQHAEIQNFDKATGLLKNVLRRFTHAVPLNFLSPSFYRYIQVESHTHTIKVRESFTDQVICSLPSHFNRFLLDKKENFSTEQLFGKILFLEEDLIMLILEGTYEVVFHIETQRVVSSFNTLNPMMSYNQDYFPEYFGKFDTHSATKISSAMKNLLDSHMERDQNSFFEKQRTPLGLVGGGNSTVNQNASSIANLAQEEDKVHFKGLQALQDFVFMNMKRERHMHFLSDNSQSFVTQDKDQKDKTFLALQGSHSDMKLQSVNSFSYALWKMIEDVSTDKVLHIKDLSHEQLALLCFAVLPDTQNQRLKKFLESTKDRTLQSQILSRAQKAQASCPTLLHKLTLKHPEAVKELIYRMNVEWPTMVIPHVQNAEGITPLKLADLKRQRRVIGWLLDHLKDYPFGYGSHGINELLCKFVDSGFEDRVGAFLDSRFQTPLWTQNYQIGRLVLSERGYNQTSINNWPAVTKYFEEKFFEKDAAQVPCKLQLLDVPNLHIYSNQEGVSFLMALTNSDINIFSHRSVQTLIEYAWENAKPTIFWWLILPFVLYIATYMVYLEFLFREHTDTSSETLEIIRIVIQVLLLGFAIYFLQLHARQLGQRGHKMDQALLWSSVDLIPLGANLISIVISIIGYVQQKENYQLLEYQRPIYAFATLFLWFKVFYFLRVFREIGHLVRMIFNVMYSMRYFFIVFFCFIVAFSSSFYALNMANEASYATNMLFVFNLTIRKADTSWFGESEGYEILTWFTFIVASMFFTYILLNLTVSMVKSMHDANLRVKEQNFYLVMTQLVLDCFHYVQIPRSELSLAPPTSLMARLLSFRSQQAQGGFDHTLTTQQTQSSSRFAVNLQPGSFCNQYLMVARTDEAEEQKLDQMMDQQTMLCQLQKQVARGFSSVQQSMQQAKSAQNANAQTQQNYQVQPQIPNSAASQLQPNVQSIDDDAIPVGNRETATQEGNKKNSMVVSESEMLKRIELVEERHRQEIDELKRGQIEIIKLLKNQQGFEQQNE